MKCYTPMVAKQAKGSGMFRNVQEWKSEENSVGGRDAGSGLREEMFWKKFEGIV